MAAAAAVPEYSEAVIEYARYLGISEHEPELLWIAQEGFDAELPDDWTAHHTSDGKPFFFNHNTNTRCPRHTNHYPVTTLQLVVAPM